MAKETASATFERVWNALCRRKWLAATVFAIPCSVVVGLVPFLPSRYRADAVVLVERQQVPEAFVKSTVTSGLETRLQTISQEILSRARLEALIRRFDLYHDLRTKASPEVVLAQIRRDVRVELKGVEALVRGSAIVAFTVSYVGNDPQTAAEVANTLAAYYLAENTKAREQQASGTAEFLRRQLNDVKDRLATQESLVSAFKRRHAGESPKNVDANLVFLDRLNAQLRLNSDNQSRSLERLETLEKQLASAEAVVSPPVAGTASTSPIVAPDPPDPKEQRLVKLREELTALQTRYKDSYPDVVGLKAEIIALERELPSPKTSASKPALTANGGSPKPPTKPNPAVTKIKEQIADVESELAALRREEKRLRDDFAMYKLRVENAPIREQEFREISRDYETTSELYQTLLKRYEEAQLAETLEQRQKGEQFRVLESALPPRIPVAPNRPALLLVGLLLSVGLAVAAVMAAEQFDTSFHSVEDLRRSISLPVLARIPPIETRSDISARLWRQSLTAVGIAASVGLLIWASYLTATGRIPRASDVAQSMLLRN
jgi:polysaccharide chain length determinant protein (PEP-CTERM system associated)